MFIIMNIQSRNIIIRQRIFYFIKQNNSNKLMRYLKDEVKKKSNLTINATLILKMRDIIFFCGQTT